MSVARVAGAGPRTRAIGQGHKRADAWAELRRRLLSAKMRDALLNERLEIRGLTYTVVKKLGGGGFGQVYLVYGENQKLRAAKVCIHLYIRC